jgi:hypothetical protein
LLGSTFIEAAEAYAADDDVLGRLLLAELTSPATGAEEWVVNAEWSYILTLA